MKLISESAVESIRKGDMEPLRVIFDANYQYCVNNLRKIFGCTESDAKDLAMDAILVLREKIMASSYTNQNVQSYLLTVASNKWRNKRKRDSRLMEYNPAILEEYVASQEQSSEKEHYKNQVERVIHAINSLMDPCKSILKMNLIEGYSLDTVYERLGYKNKAVLKATKTRCMRKLRQIVKAH